MSYRTDTIAVTDVSFAPTGSEVTWTVSGIDGVTSIVTIIVGKDADAGTVDIFYDSTPLPPAVLSLTEDNLSSPVITKECALPDIVLLPFTVTAGNAADDVSGGSTALIHGDTLHIWSSTYTITIGVDGSVQIEP